MRLHILTGAVLSLLFATAAEAEVPSVAVDILPVHSLVSQVMKGVGSPHLIVPPGASPHGYALRPSDATALQKADVVIWVGGNLDPWLKEPIGTLARHARSVELVETEGTTELPFREGAGFEKHDHGSHDHDHDHGDAAVSHDPHAWLDPENGRVWMDAIATELAAADPEHADTYRANAAEGRARLTALSIEIKARLAPSAEAHFIVFHDAYQYFEKRFGIAATGSIRLSDATDPSPARIAAIRDKVTDLKISCVFTEPQFNPGLVKAVFAKTGARTGVLDPLGADLPAGPDLYPQLLRNLADSLASCL